MSADVDDVHTLLRKAAFEHTKASAERSDCKAALRKIVAMWDDLAAGRHVDGAYAKSLIEHARRLVEGSR